MMELHRHELPPAAALTYVRGGKGAATLVGASTSYTYEFSCPQDHGCTWVSVLIGTDNSSDYAYVGFIPNNTVDLVAGRKGNPEHPAFKALAWYLNKAYHAPEVAQKAQFWHEGKCAKCGARLTAQESIERGIGPKCWGAMN